MARIVVSYRRLDSAAIAGRIFDRLSQRYGDSSVFMDIDNIPAGVDFRDRIGDALRASDALIVVIGPKWVDPKKRGHTTIQDETDWVRIELETALRQKIPVIPALVQGATMPKADQLPPSLRDFAFRNAATIDAGQDFNTHIERLTRAIDQIAGAAAAKIVEPAGAASMPAEPKQRERTGLLVGFALAAVALVGLVIVGVTWPRVPELFTPASFQKKEADPSEPRWVSSPPPGSASDAPSRVTIINSVGSDPQPSSPSNEPLNARRSASPVAGVNNAVSAYEAKDFVRAASLAEPFAKQGDPDSQFIMGRLYETGRSVSADPAIAAEWYRKAAEQGFVKAQYNLGTLYLNGTGVPKDARMAAEWFSKAATQGHHIAEFSLATMYENGDGVTRDRDQARRWYTEVLKSDDQALVQDARDAIERLNSRPTRRR